MKPFDCACPHCTATLRVTIAELIGRSVRCPQCKEPFRIENPQTSDILEEAVVGAGSSKSIDSGLGSHIGYGDESHTGIDSQLLSEEDAYDDAPVDIPEAVTLAWHADDEDTSHDVAEAKLLESPAEVEADEEYDETEDEEPFVETDDYSSGGESTAVYAPRRSGSQTNPGIIIGGVVGALLMLVALILVVDAASTPASNPGAQRQRGGPTYHRPSRAKQRNPREFADFARDAERQGW